MNQNELNLREAWLRTEFFGSGSALTAGRLDLTNYFDRNAAANDETTQFISDALVNNQMLGLAVNGTGVVADYDPKNGVQLQVRRSSRATPTRRACPTRSTRWPKSATRRRRSRCRKGNYRAVVPREQRRRRVEARASASASIRS